MGNLVKIGSDKESTRIRDDQSENFSTLNVYINKSIIR